MPPYSPCATRLANILLSSKAPCQTRGAGGFVGNADLNAAAFLT